MGNGSQYLGNKMSAILPALAIFTDGIFVALPIGTDMCTKLQ